jgi:Putative Flp pilus-assembly TadE/G-like
VYACPDQLRSSQSTRRTGGFVLITMVISAAALLVCIGLGIDAAYLQLMKTRMQTAADAAAVGGVQQIKQNGAAGAATAAKGDSALNGFTDGQKSVTVSVNNPPAAGYYTSDATAVEVRISQNVGTLFMRVVGITSISVTARSVARQGASPDCVYALDPSASNAISISGGANLAVNCGVIIDSNNTLALNASGGAHVTTTGISIVGGYQVSGGAVLSPTPATHVSPESDPLSYLTPPSAGYCTQNNWSASGGVKAIAQGVYCGGINISGGATVTMSSGTYILLGGGINVSGGSHLTGSGVTFYNTAGPGFPYGAVNFSGGTTLNLSAPTTGSLAGILFFQDRSISSPSPSTISGGASAVFDGALYFPTSALSYSGGAASDYTIIVSKTISFSGGSTLNSNYSSLPGGSPVKGSAVLSE